MIGDNLSGKRFGKVTVLNQVGVSNSLSGKHRVWKCKCDCGEVLDISSKNIKRLKNPSCKTCFNSSLGSHRHTTGGALSKEYISWIAMKGRCLNKNNKKYRSYGGRGIKICEVWLKDFSRFYADVGPAPSPEHTIDRIDVNGNYEPGNVRWATVDEQINNKTNNRHVFFGDHRLTVAQAASILGVQWGTLHARAKRHNWNLTGLQALGLHK